MKAPSIKVVLIALAGLAAGLFAGKSELWSSGAKPAIQTGLSSTAQAAQSAQTGVSNEAETLQNSFVRVSEQAGPAVVSISTEQIEKIRQYFKGHPFMGSNGEDPFEEFFRQFYGEAPERELRRFGLGSGVIIDERGFILTNEHVVADADKITVTLADGREMVGTVKGKDSRSDLAVVQVDAKKLPSARLGDSNNVRAGQWAVALGNPFGLIGSGASVRATGAEPTLTVGVISAVNRQLPRVSRFDRDYSGLIQTDAAINPGNSGGPLLNLNGEVIGINVAILTSSRGFEGIGFAIPINKAKAVLSTLIEGKQVIYGWLGVQIQDITDDVAEYYGLKDRDGILVYQVLPDGPASKAGLKAGDIVKAFDGQPIHHSRELVDRVGVTKVGVKAPLEVLRDGKRLTLQVEIAARKSEEEQEAGEPAEIAEAWRGLKVKNVSPEASEQLSLPADVKGVVIVDVKEDSPADQAGLRSGDVINEINRVRIDSITDYRKVTASAKGKVLIRTNRGYVVLKEEDGE